jgi:hypothetical protein
MTIEAKKEVHHIESQISEVIALQSQLLRDVATLKRDAESVMATGSPINCWLDLSNSVLSSDLSMDEKVCNVN